MTWEYKFCACHGIPLMTGNHCAVTGDECLIVVETVENTKEPDNINVDLELVTAPHRITVVDFDVSVDFGVDGELNEPTGFVHVQYQRSDRTDVMHTNIAVKELIQFGDGQYWQRGFFHQYTDHDGDETYDAIVSRHRRCLVSDPVVSTAEYNAEQKRNFIRNITTRILEDYLSQQSITT